MLKTPIILANESIEIIAIGAFAMDVIFKIPVEKHTTQADVKNTVVKLSKFTYRYLMTEGFLMYPDLCINFKVKGI